MSQLYVAGLDLGQSKDPSAMCVLEPRVTGAVDDAGERYRYLCSHLERYPLGTRYPAIVQSVTDQMRVLLKHSGTYNPPILAIDSTGVGRAVVDIFTESEITDLAVVFAVTITASGEPRFEREGNLTRVWVCKRDLVGVVQVALQLAALQIIPKLPLADVLRRELMDFRIKVTAAANETFNAREGAHDDLVLALATALWTHQNQPAPVYVVTGVNPFENVNWGRAWS